MYKMVLGVKISGLLFLLAEYGDQWREDTYIQIF